MPFLGQDWRSPGEQWVKTQEGWERLKMWRMKVFESLNENVIARLFKLYSDDYEERKRELTHRGQKPHVLINRAATKENKTHTTVTEALSKLDMSVAVKDIRRFNYVCKLLELIIKHKLTSLSGTAQKYVFNLLEDVLQQVIKTQNNFHVIGDLLDITRMALEDGHYYHIGSSSLWSKHEHVVSRMQNRLQANELQQREEDGGMTLVDLPEECIRDILLCLTDGEDIIRTGLTGSKIQPLSEDNLLWKKLCFFHFNNRQINTFLPKNKTYESQDVDWPYMYQRLVKRFGRRETYAEMLFHCLFCHCLFWESHGHPCHSSGDNIKTIPVSPEMFLQYFTV